MISTAEDVEMHPRGLAELAEAFARPAPLEVDLGSGNGAFLVALATLFPERNFLGVERLSRRIGNACRAAVRNGVGNVRVLRWEINDAVRSFLPAESVAVFHVLFPDPWPKRRHHVRRLINDSFLRAAWAALELEGELRFMTDDRHYFEQTRKLLPAHPFKEELWAELPGYPRTEFEQRYRVEGRAVYRLRLRKT